MKKLTTLLTVLLLCSFLSAQRKFDVKIKCNEHQNEQPTLSVYLPVDGKNTGRAILALPGGAYSHLAINHEGHDWAPFYNDLGIAYAVLQYRMPNGNKNIPINDALGAMKTLRDSAEVWNINPYDIGIMGSSAGGHLASTIATTAPYTLRPNFQILFYPVISMELGKSHTGSVHSLLGKNPTMEEQRKYSNEKNVMRHLTPPALLLLSQNDLVVPVSNSINYFNALSHHDVPASMHIYPSGNHGYGCNKNFEYHQQMLNDITIWLTNLKTHHKDDIRIACIGNSITDGFGIPFSEQFGYPALLNNMLGEGYTVKNFGVSAHTLLKKGDLPYMGHPAYQACKDYNPDIVIIKLGTNDSKPHNWQHKDDFAKDLQFMIDELKSLPAKPEIYLTYPIPVSKDNYGITDSVMVNGIRPIINKVAKKNKLQIIDLYSPLKGHDNWMMSDGIHPNREGVRVMAETVKKAIESKLRK